jgi:hypothetical protein
MDRLAPFGTPYLRNLGITRLDGQALMETACPIKPRNSANGPGYVYVGFESG